jgi:hypothetical protein
MLVPDVVDRDSFPFEHFEHTDVRSASRTPSGEDETYFRAPGIWFLCKRHTRIVRCTEKCDGRQGNDNRHGIHDM